MFGSISSVEELLPEADLDRVDLRAAVCRTRPFGFVLKPSACSSSAGSVGRDQRR